MASFFSSIRKLVGKPEEAKQTPAQIAAAKEKAMKERKFGPLFVRFNPDVKCDKAGQRFIINDDTNPIDFETEFFIGRMVVRVKNAEHAPETTYWKGKARKFSIQVQGRFKKRLCTNNVRSGSYFQKNIIAPWGASIPMKILCAIDPSLRHDVFAKKNPWVASPLICAVEQCSIQKPTGDTSNRGLGPWTFGGERRIEEDSHLFLPEAIRESTPKMGFKQRCHYYADEKLRKSTYWETDLIYNFDFLSSRVDFNKFSCVVGPFRKDMAPYMNQQPFDFRATVYDEETNSKIIGTLYAIQFFTDGLYQGKPPKDELTRPVDAAPMEEPLDFDAEKTAAEYANHLGLSPASKKSKSMTEASDGAAAAAATQSDAAPALPEASASDSAAASSE